MQYFLIRLISYSRSLTFKCWGSNAVVLVLLKLLMIPGGLEKLYKKGA